MVLAILIKIDNKKNYFTVMSARDTDVQNLDLKALQRILGRPTRKHVNKMHGTISAVHAEAKTSHDSFPLGSKFGFSAAILKKDKYIALPNTVATGLTATANLATTCLSIHPSQTETYDDTILALHPKVFLRKKEAQRAELITQYETFEGYEEAFKEKLPLPVTRYIFSQYKTIFLGLPTNLSLKCSTISSSNA